MQFVNGRVFQDCANGGNASRFGGDALDDQGVMLSDWLELLKLR